MTIRTLRAADLPAVERLQNALEYADSDLPAAAVDGPFLGRVAVEGGGVGDADGVGGDGGVGDRSGDGDTVVGYAIALSGTRVTISELAVDPAHRRRGHGRSLVDAVAVATDADALVVTTPAGNEAARRFYEAVGFERDDRIAGFYADGTDALRLVRRE